MKAHLDVMNVIGGIAKDVSSKNQHRDRKSYKVTAPSHHAMDAHCHLQAREVRARTVPFNFVTEPVPAWETAFSLWWGDSKVHLTAVVDNRVFPGD